LVNLSGLREVSAPAPPKHEVFIVGLDIGQVSDFTALSVLEPIRDGKIRRYDLRHLERIRGKPYPFIVELVRERIAALSPARVSVAVDATGVGTPIVELLQNARLGVTIYPIWITGGDSVSKDGYARRVPKRDLASTVQVILQERRLRVAKALPLTEVLLREMLEFRVKITSTAHDVYGVWREGIHDDLVLSVALACWIGENESTEPWPKELFEESQREYRRSVEYQWRNAF
jgi:hypothetical protein